MITTRREFVKASAAFLAGWLCPQVSLLGQAPGGDRVYATRRWGVMVRVPTELFRFRSPAAEAFILDDVRKAGARCLGSWLYTNEAMVEAGFPYYVAESFTGPVTQKVTSMLYEVFDQTRWSDQSLVLAEFDVYGYYARLCPNYAGPKHYCGDWCAE